jgi:WD40 repeat protein
MRRSPRTKRIALAAGALTSLALVSLLLVLAAAKPANGPPIELGFRDTPILLDPHEHWVQAIAFSPDGTSLATGTGYLRVWDVANGQLKSIHADDAMRGIQGLAYAPDNRLVAAVGGFFGREALLWDISAGKIVQDFVEPAAAPGSVPATAAFIYKGQPINYRVLSALAYSPDGRIVATAPGDVVLREAQSGDLIAKLYHPAQGVKALAFSADGQTLATASEDKQVLLWSVPEKRLLQTLDGATQPLVSVALSEDGRQVAAISTGKKSIFDETPVSNLWTWDPAFDSPLKLSLGNVRAGPVAFAGPSTVILAAGHDVLSLELASSSPALRKTWSHNQDILALAVSPDRKLVASGGKDRNVDLVDLATGKLVRRLPGLTDMISAVSTSGDGKRFATATIDLRFTNRLPEANGNFAARFAQYFGDEANAGRIQPSEVRIWSATDGSLQSILPLPPCQVTDVELIPHSNLLVVGGWLPGKGGLLTIWDAAASKLVHTLPTPGAEVLSITTSPDGRILASGDADGNLELWELSTHTKLRSQKLDHAIEAVAYSNDGKLLAAADAKQTVRILDASNGQLKQTLPCHSFVESLDFSPDGDHLAAGTRHPGIELWNLETGKSRLLKSLGDHFATMPGFVKFSPDGRFVVCGGKGKDIAVFDVAKGELHCELSGHFHAASAAAFLPDGRLISGGEERTIRLWSTDPGELLATWVTVPADDQQGWDDEWVGYRPSGEFIGTANGKRLVGWVTGGETILGAEGGNRRRVERVIEPAPKHPPTEN